MPIQYLYCYDPINNIIHSINCHKLKLLGTKVIKYPNLSTALRKKYIPCECCRTEYEQALKERNIDIISRSKYNFIYSCSDNYFHKRNCRIVLTSTDLLGTHTFESALKTGRKPCVICNPTPQDIVIYDSWTKPYENQDFTDNTIDVKTPHEEKAVNRHREAKNERKKKLLSAVSKEEINDIYTLTQPRYSFWAAKGYQNFHLRSCASIKSLTHLIGFKSFNEARKAGYKPCRQCKPTSKHDIKISIPIYSEFKIDESLIDLEKLCHKEGYYHLHYNDIFIIVTPVGKWKVHIKTMPIKLEHINIKKNPSGTDYHVQPRVFLSLSDVFLYIKRHDESLE